MAVLDAFVQMKCFVFGNTRVKRWCTESSRFQMLDFVSAVRMVLLSVIDLRSEYLCVINKYTI